MSIEPFDTLPRGLLGLLIKLRVLEVNPIVLSGFDARFPNQNQYAYRIPYFTMRISKEESNGQA